MNQSWTECSLEWIKEQAALNPGLSKEELRKHCSSNYPYCQRSGWAYKAWLKAMRQYFNPQAMRPVVNGNARPSTQELEKRGQLRLIEEAA